MHAHMYVRMCILYKMWSSNVLCSYEASISQPTSVYTDVLYSIYETHTGTYVRVCVCVCVCVCACVRACVCVHVQLMAASTYICSYRVSSFNWLNTYPCFIQYICPFKYMQTYIIHTVYPEILVVIKFGDLPQIQQKCIIGGI